MSRKKRSGAKESVPEPFSGYFQVVARRVRTAWALAAPLRAALALDGDNAGHPFAPSGSSLVEWRPRCSEVVAPGVCVPGNSGAVARAGPRAQKCQTLQINQYVTVSIASRSRR